MGHTRKRMSVSGPPRYTAYYDDLQGKRRSAGTYGRKKDADMAWQEAEAQLRAGAAHDPERGRQRFRAYVEQTWFPNHPVELNTKSAYWSALHKYVLPEFGNMRLGDIRQEHVRAWVEKLKSNGVTQANISHCKVALSAVLTTALNDRIISFHPCQGVKVKKGMPRRRPVVSADQFDAIYQAIPERYRLLVELDIESGMRWGEIAEVRPKDINMKSGVLTVSRNVIEISRKFHPDGGIFLVKPPKSGKPRFFKLNDYIVDSVKNYIDSNSIGPEDLLFRYVPPVESARRPGRSAVAEYRARRRAEGKDHPRKPRSRRTDADGHISRQWFTRQVWQPALAAVGLDGLGLRFHDLRRAHASWLIAGGADIQIVKERLGHSSIVTTQLYLSALADADETALAAIARVRGRMS